VSGPLAVRWLGYELEAPRAGTTGRARISLQNAGSATWRARGVEGVKLSYHWLDPLGNPIVWDGVRTELPGPLPPGRAVELEVTVVAPRPPGRYRLSFDLVEEFRFWFAELGSTTLEIDVDVAPRIAARRLAVVVHGPADADTAHALATQEEAIVEHEPEAVAHLVAGALPARDWSRRLLDAHAEGWAAVGCSLVTERRSERARYAAWAAGGRNPRFTLPLLLPSLLVGLEPGEHEGLPAYLGGDGLFEGRAEVRLRPRSGRPPA
jgi:hypothetical protein